MATLKDYSSVIDAAAALIEALHVIGYVDGGLEDIIRDKVFYLPYHVAIEDYDLLDDVALSYLLQPLED